MPKPDLGENVRVFSPEDGLENIHRVTEDVFKRQHKRQFGPERYAFLFLPGDSLSQTSTTTPISTSTSSGRFRRRLPRGVSMSSASRCSTGTTAGLPAGS